MLDSQSSGLGERKFLVDMYLSMGRPGHKTRGGHGGLGRV
jgi:hypothetical protein